MKYFSLYGFSYDKQSLIAGKYLYLLSYLLIVLSDRIISQKKNFITNSRLLGAGIASIIAGIFFWPLPRERLFSTLR